MRAPHSILTGLAVLAHLALLYAGACGAGPLPPLGPLLDPNNGVWAAALTARPPAEASGHVSALGDSVEVLYDVRGVPHIFARTERDATRALGYVVARDRLFQLEMQARAAAGTLTELVGSVALPADREARRLGLAWSAEREWAAMSGDERAALEAFAAGVNAYLDRLPPERVPVEYRLLGTRPQRWEPIHSVYLHRRMGYTLSYRTDELLRERVVALVGAEAADALFPVHAPIVEPIVPGGRRYPVFDTTPLPPPARSARAAVSSVPPASSTPSQLVAAGRRDGVGSNNWAVAPSRSATGHALLAGDPHLELTLPSIWYEVHMVAAEARRGPPPSAAARQSAGRGEAELDVYGVTIPGAPGVVIGFNRDVAWSFTNTQSDVIDYYRETLDDVRAPARYRLDGEWRRLESRVETFRDRRGRVIHVDTIYHTHRGPIIWRDSTPYSIRWTLYESRNSWAPFAAAQRARSAEEWMRAMAAFDVPPQNGAVADRHGTIAIQSAGYYPLRPGDGRGDRVFDGSTSASDWIGRVPAGRVPVVRNPAQGYVASANQEPFDPRQRPEYFAADWYAPWRAMRINALLRANDAVTPDDMRRFQTDPETERVKLFRPLFLRAVGAVTGAKGQGDRGSKADTLLARAVELLSAWDGRYTSDNRRAVLFEMAMGELERRTWDELLDPATGRYVWMPAASVLWRLTYHPTSAWWDVGATDAIEDRDAVLSASLRAAMERALMHHGDPESDGWRWDRVQTANIYHYLRIPSFSVRGVALQGGPGALNPLSGGGTDGASWRMVVELGEEVAARAAYPGGQSGNPVSPWYDNHLPTWAKGELDAVIFPRTPDELRQRPIAARLTLAPEGR